MISKVAASEIERAQTGVRALRGSDRKIVQPVEMKRMGIRAIESESLVTEDKAASRYPEYHETRETLWERAGTTP